MTLAAFVVAGVLFLLETARAGRMTKLAWVLFCSFCAAIIMLVAEGPS